VQYEYVFPVRFVVLEEFDLVVLESTASTETSNLLFMLGCVCRPAAFVCRPIMGGADMTRRGC
jgi:hypothetical protein